VLAHTPGLVRHGSKPSRELADGADGLDQELTGSLRSFDDAVAYPPNQVFIGNLAPDALWDLPRPWWANGVSTTRSGRFGEILDETELMGLLKVADEFDLVRLQPDFAAVARERLIEHGLWTEDGLTRLAPVDGSKRQAGASADKIPLMTADGTAIGTMAAGYPGDSSQEASVLLENLACKASGALAVKRLLALTGLAADDVDYLIGCGEEAVGDRYQRGGGSMAKAIAEMAGCINSTGADVKAFCSGPIHALVMAGALVQAGIHRNVIVVGGGSLAKLGMKLRGHLASETPILEDCLAAVAVLVGPPDDVNPRLRLDVIGRHRVQAAGSARAIYESLVVEPLESIGLKIPDIDRYAVELHNPEITEGSGSGNVPQINYRTIGGLAVLRSELARADLDAFERKHGMPGFCPTQGHIPAAWPYLAHARDRMAAGEERRLMLIAKGSLFLGKMTGLSDGMSILVEAPD
jgi:betaine reductase